MVKISANTRNDGVYKWYGYKLELYPNYFPSPLRHNLPIDLLLLHIIPLDDQHDFVANGEGGVGVVKGIRAHADRPVWQVAEDAAGVFARDDGLAAGADGVAQLGAVEGVGMGFFDREQQRPGLFVVALDDAVQFVPGVILRPQVGNGRVAHFPLGQVDVKAVALHQAPARANSQDAALDSGIQAVQGRLGGEVIAACGHGQPPGPDGEAALPVHMDNDKIDDGSGHVPQNKAGPFFVFRPHLRLRDQDAHAERDHDGAVHRKRQN